MNKFLIPLIIFSSVPVPSISSSDGYFQSSNEIIKELNDSGVDLDEYTSQKEIVLATEKHRASDNKDLLVFYVYNPEASKGRYYSNITYSCWYSNSKKSELEKNYRSYNLDLELLGYSEDYRYQKYMCDITSTFQSTNYRSYKITTLRYPNARLTSDFDFFDERFDFRKNSDGDIEYAKESFDYVVLNNELCYAILTEENTNGWIGELFDRRCIGYNNLFYGFNVSNYDIKDLLEIEFLYDVYNYQVLCAYNWNHSTVDAYNGFFSKEYLDEKLSSGEIDQTKYNEVLPYTDNYYQLVESNKRSVIVPGKKVVQNDHWFETEYYEWNSIMKMSDLDNYCDPDSFINKSIKNVFGNRQWVVNFDSFSYLVSRENAIDGSVFITGDGTHRPVDELKLKYIEEGNDPRCWWVHDYYGVPYLLQNTYNYLGYFQSKSCKNIQVVRMKFVDYDDNEYNLSVISTPVDVSGVVADKDDSILNQFSHYLFDTDAGKTFMIVIGVVIVILALFLLRFLIVPKKRR